MRRAGVPAPAFSILKELRKRHTAEDLAIAIEGLALVRDFPDIYADAVDWLHPGQKTTLKALYNSKSGVADTFTIARHAYWTHVNRSRRTGRDRAAMHIGDVDALRTAARPR